MSGPSVVVDRAPEGWTHIGGPGMHLLIGLDEDDERTIAASDAADGGDLDDVVEVLTKGGMRKAHHFVGVHWQPRTRIVAFGPVSALVTLVDGSEHDVRATSGKVWTDLELPDHPERVRLRVLEESERSQPTLVRSLVAEPLSARVVSVLAADAEKVDDTDQTHRAAEGEAAGGQNSGAIRGGESSSAPSGSEQDRSEESVTQADPHSAGSQGRWPLREVVAAGAGDGPTELVQSPDQPAVEASPPHAPPSAPAAGTRELPSWTSVTPAVPVRARPVPEGRGDATTGAGEAPAPSSAPSSALPSSALPSSAHSPSPVVSAAGTPPAAPAPRTSSAPAAPSPVADDLPLVAPRDVDSTWAVRPVLDPDAATPVTPPTPSPVPARASNATPPAAGLDEPDDEQPAAPPSYDYLFGHTTAADEHRKVLASLAQPDDDETGQDEDDHLPVPVVPAVADVSDTPVGTAAPPPDVPARPIPTAAAVPEGGLISSVPWARSTPPAEVAEPEPVPDVPTFSGRHTPPPAPSLLPPMNTPPPGVRAPEATPLISTGPPPPGTPPPTTAAPSAPTAATAYPPEAQPHEEPTYDVPVTAPAAPRVAPVAAAAPGTEQITSPPAPTAAPAADVDTVTDDETELTVDRSALIEARIAAQNQAFSGPSVLAVLCATGHPTPPHSDRCRVCGSSIPPQEPFTMPRPPLGVLRLSTGDVVTLDRSVLLGRAPRPGDGLGVHDRPHVVKVPSPERDVSRNHVEVILEGWHVLIRDLGTTNGTTVTLPGESPLRLRANDQQVLEPGSSVSMADEVSFTFEASP